MFTKDLKYTDNGEENNVLETQPLLPMVLTCAVSGIIEPSGLLLEHMLEGIHTQPTVTMVLCTLYSVMQSYGDSWKIGTFREATTSKSII